MRTESAHNETPNATTEETPCEKLVRLKAAKDRLQNPWGTAFRGQGTKSRGSSLDREGLDDALAQAEYALLAALWILGADPGLSLRQLTVAAYDNVGVARRTLQRAGEKATS